MRSSVQAIYDALIHTSTASLPRDARISALVPPQHSRILVIDGSMRARILLSDFLQRQGYAVQLAASAREARHLLAKQPTDLILLDLLLPDQSGADLLRDLRHHPQTAHAPIIVLSTLATDFHIAAGLRHGADDYITKPADLLTVLARIQDWLQPDFKRD